jgi:apoptosis-inducing factor 3
MRSIKVGEKDDEKVLIARYQGKLYSTGNFCSHFGVPLEGGMLFDDKVLCPAHAAGFSIITGQPESAPGLDGLPSFPVVERDGKFFVQIPKEGLPKKVSQATAKRDPNDKRHFVVVGGGCAGLNCAETLRQSGFTGQITVLSNEDMVPYDRTLITKALPVGDATKWALRPEQYLKDCDIDYKLKSGVFSINREQKKVITNGGDHYYYDKLCLAPGSNAFKPPIPGIDSKNVHFVRTHKDQKDIKEKAATAKSIVILGASFIGSEAAASLAMKYGKEKEIHMICDTEVPFEL